MTLLHRYLVRQNLFLLFVILMVGSGLYVLTDLFERIDSFMAAGFSFFQVLMFFLAKLPMIISQILPAVFLLAVVIQLNILRRTNEFVALQAGGISPLVILRFLLVYGTLWAMAQLAFSQYIGVVTDRYATYVWEEKVKGRDDSEQSVRGLWFTEKNYVVHLDYAAPNEKRGEGLLAYELSKDRLSIETIIQADHFTIEKKAWQLQNGSLTKPENFNHTVFDTYSLPMKQDLQAFASIGANKNPSLLPLWDLGDIIRHLKNAGSNVEALRVVWHSKIAYAASILVVGLFALAISLATSSIYKAIGYSLITIFLFYTATTFCSTMGQKGILPPILSAWGTDFVAFCIAILWVLWPGIRSKTQRG